MGQGNITTANLTNLALEMFPMGDETFEQMNRKAALLDFVESGDGFRKFPRSKQEGKYIVMPLIVSGNPNAGIPVAEFTGTTSGANAGALPTPGYQVPIQAKFNIKDFFSAIRVTGRAIDTLGGGEESVVDVLDMEMEKEILDARSRFNVFMYSDGSGLVSGFDTGTTNWVAATKTFTGADTSKMKVGMQLAIRGLTTGTATTINGATWDGSPLQVATIVSSTSFTVDAAHGLTNDANASLAAQGLYLWDTQGQDVIGLDIITDTANPATWGGTGSAAYWLGQLNRSSSDAALYVGNKQTAGSNPVSIEDHIQPLQAAIIAARNMIPPYAFTRFQNWDTIANQLRADVRQDATVKVLKENYQAINFGGTDFIKDKDAPASKIYFIQPEDLFRYVINPWFWDTKSGAIFNRVSASFGGATTVLRWTDAFDAMLKCSQQVVPARCNGCGQIYSTSATT